jgi:hypothetical protein
MTLPYSCLIQVFITVAWQQRGEATRRDERLVHGSAWFGSARLGSVRLGSPRLGSILLGSARRKRRFVYYCVIAGVCFDVTVLAWRKYATIYFPTEDLLYTNLLRK